MKSISKLLVPVAAAAYFRRISAIHFDSNAQRLADLHP
jgi:hypothetical protein